MTTPRSLFVSGTCSPSISGRSIGPCRLRAVTVTLKGERLEDRFRNGGPSLQQTCWHLLLHHGDGFHHHIKCQERLLAPDGHEPWW